MQGTVATFTPETRCGTVLLDNGTELAFDAKAFVNSGLRLLRLGQRVKMHIVDGQIAAITHISFPLPDGP